MIKKMITKKMIVTTAAVFAMFLIYIIPNYNYEKIEPEQELEYVDSDVITSKIYLFNNTELLGRTEVVVSSNDIEVKARELLEVLISGGAGENKIPSGFKGVLPSETKINTIEFDNNVLKIDFSKDLLDVKKEYEEKIIEAIVYTMTGIDGVDKVIIYVDGDILNKLPQTGKVVPPTLDRSYGINKEYKITSTSNIKQVNVYYIDKYNDNYYYVPVTKYLNDDRESIQIVIDELTSTNVSSTNLMSFLNGNTKLLAVKELDNSLALDFNSFIFNDLSDKKILEEVLYTISLSVGDNYNVENVVFTNDNEEITQIVIKTLE